MADLEEDERPCGLCTIVLVGRDLGIGEWIKNDIQEQELRDSVIRWRKTDNDTWD